MHTKRLLMFAGTLIALGIALSTGSTPANAYAGCGIKPIKPIPPIGCADLEAECSCDIQGQNCKWTWKCVTKKK